MPTESSCSLREKAKLTVHVIDHLVSDPAVVLEDVVVLCAGSDRDLLGHWEKFGQVLVWNVVELGTVVLGDDQCVPFRNGTNVCMIHAFEGIS